MRFGIFNDLHLGHQGVGHWHNRLMYDRAQEIVRAAIAVLNQQSLNAVFALGDITEGGQPAQVALAREVLGELNVPWYVLPGNHDRAAVHSGAFDETFTGHVIQPYMRWGDIGMISMRERVPDGMDNESGHSPDQAWLTAAIDAFQADHPSTLIILSHFPLLDESLWAAQHNGKDAGHLTHGEALVMQLHTSLSLPHKPVILCGHQHWHHNMAGHHAVQCTTAAMIEYPMEMRIVSIEATNVHISTLDTPTPDIAAESLETAAWVRGREQDRTTTLTLQV